jgi:hypothetical protein
LIGGRGLFQEKEKGCLDLKARWVTETDTIRRKPVNRAYTWAKVETAKSKPGKEIV